jgi:hypothetical protein
MCSTLPVVGLYEVGRVEAQSEGSCSKPMASCGTSGQDRVTLRYRYKEGHGGSCLEAGSCEAWNSLKHRPDANCSRSLCGMVLSAGRAVVWGSQLLADVTGSAAMRTGEVPNVLACVVDSRCCSEQHVAKYSKATPLDALASIVWRTRRGFWCALVSSRVQSPPGASVQ